MRGITWGAVAAPQVLSVLAIVWGYGMLASAIIRTMRDLPVTFRVCAAWPLDIVASVFNWVAEQIDGDGE